MGHGFVIKKTGNSLAFATLIHRIFLFWQLCALRFRLNSPINFDFGKRDKVTVQLSAKQFSLIVYENSVSWTSDSCNVVEDVQ